MEAIPVSAKTKVLALLGSPVSHSISPRMHNTAFALAGLDMIYVAFEVSEASLPAAVAGIRSMGIAGFNLTMPCKSAMVPLCDELSPAAALIGAVNTVENTGGRLIGHNTDGIGFLRAALEEGFEPEGAILTVLGAGGAASSIISQAALEGARRIHIFQRPNSRHAGPARELALRISSRLKGSLEICFHESGDSASLKEAVGESSLLVNATSAGMAPNTGISPLWDQSVLRPSLLVGDVIYNPVRTLFTEQAKAAGCRVFSGLPMLYYQGEAAFEIWTGQKMPAAVREQVFSGKTP